jgi:hypothetical protein
LFKTSRTIFRQAGWLVQTGAGAISYHMTMFRPLRQPFILSGVIAKYCDGWQAHRHSKMQDA